MKTIQKYLLIVLSFYCLTETVLGQSIDGSNSTNYKISYENIDGKAFSPIEISGAPSNAYVTSISFELNIDHDNLSEVDFWVGTDSWSSEAINAFKTGNNWTDGFNETYEGSHSVELDINDSQSPNQTWYLVAQDLTSGNDGRIDSWSIEVNYAIPQPADLNLTGFDTNWNVGSEGGSNSGQVCNEGDITMQWGIATAGEDYWFGVNPSSGSIGGGQCQSVSISVDKNPSTTDNRNSSVSFYDIDNTDNVASVIINQSRALTPANIEVKNHPGGYDKVWEVNVAGAAETVSLENSGEETGYWSVSKSKNWITVEKDGSVTTGGNIAGGGTDYFQITISDNYDNPDDLTGYIRIFDVDNQELFRLDIIQAGDPPDPSDLRTTFDQEYTNISHEGTDINEQIYNDGGETLNWEAKTNDGWLSADPSSGQIQPGNYTNVTLTIGQNPDQVERDGRIAFFNNDNTDIDETEGVNIYQNAAPVVNNIPIARASDISGQPSELYPNGLYSVSAIYTDPDGRDDIKSAQLRLTHPDGNEQQDIVLNWNREGNEFYPWESGDGKNYVDRLLSVDVEEVTNGYKLTWNFVIKPQWPETSSGIRYGVRALDMSDTETNPVWDYDGSDTIFQNPTGITVLVHGLNLTGDNNGWNFLSDFSPNDYWLKGEFVDALLNAYGGGLVYEYNPDSGVIEDISNSIASQYYNPNGEKIILHNWAKASDDSEAGQVEAAAESFFAALIENNIVDINSLDNPSFHFISHSRGTSVSSEIIQRLGYYDIEVTYQTNLDVHDFDEGDVPRDENFHDPSVQIWDNVEYADNFWQWAVSNLVPSGRPLGHLIKRYPFEVELSSQDPNLNHFGEPGYFPHTHARVINWYLGTINTGDEDQSWYRDGLGYDAGFSRWRKHGGHAYSGDYEGFSTLNTLANPKTSKNIISYSHESSNYYPDEDYSPIVFFNGDFDIPDLDINAPAGWSFHGGGGEGFVSNNELLLGFNNLYRDFPFLSKTHNRFYIPENAVQIFFEYNIKIHDKRDNSNSDKLQVLIGDEIVIDNILLNNESVKAGGLPIDFERIFNKSGREFRGTVNTLTFRVDSPSGSPRSVIAIDDIRMVLDREDLSNTKPNEPIARLPLEDEFINTLTPTFEWSEFINGGDGDTQSGYQVRVRDSESVNEDVVYDTGLITDIESNLHTYSPGSYTGSDPATINGKISLPLEAGKKYHWHVRVMDSGGDWSDWSSDSEGKLRYFTPIGDGDPAIAISYPYDKVVWNTGSTQSIEWSSANISGNLKLELWENGQFHSDINEVSSDNNVYSWEIPSTIENSPNYQIKIYSLLDETIEDLSDEFTIFTDTSVPTYLALGTIVDDSGNALESVEVLLAGGEERTSSTNSNGEFSFSDLTDGNYTVTPSLLNYTFTPSERNISISGSNLSNLDFTGTMTADPPVLSINDESVPSQIEEDGAGFNIGVENTGGGTLAWTATSSANWIDADVEVLDENTGSGTIHVYVHPYRGCGSFDRSGQIKISSSNASESPQIVEIYQTGFEYYSEAPDLIAKSVSGPAEVYLGENIPVQISYSNSGDEAAPSGWTGAIYLTSSNTELDGSEIEVFSFVEEKELCYEDPATEVEVNLAIPDTITAGTYYYALQLDVNDKVYEYEDLYPYDDINNNLVFSESVEVFATSPLKFEETIDPITLRAGDTRNQIAETYLHENIASLFGGGSGTVTYTASSSDPTLVEANIAEGNLSIGVVGAGTDEQVVTVTLTGTDENDNSADGTMEVTVHPAYGDPNADGRVNSLDAARVLQSVVELYTFNTLQQDVADIDRSGSINSYDATLILQYAVELIDRIPLGDPQAMMASSTVEGSSSSASEPVTWGEIQQDGQTLLLPVLLNTPGPVYSIDLSGTFEADAGMLEEISFPELPDGWMTAQRVDKDGELFIAMAGTEPFDGERVAVLRFTLNEFSQQIGVEGKGYLNNSSYTLEQVAVQEVIDQFALENNFPNPFNPSTNLRYQLPAPSDVRIEMYNTAGQRVMQVLDARQNSGTYTLNVDMSAFSSGVYFIRFVASSGQETYITTSKMTLIK